MSISEYTIRNCVLGLKCDASWNEMRVVRQRVEVVDTGGVRFCGGCQKEVYDCMDDSELRQNIALNRCIRISNNPAFDTITGYVPLEPD